MKIECPDCGSRNVKKSSAVVQQGTRTASGTSRGGWISSAGRVGVSGRKYSSVSTTGATDLNAPPAASQPMIGALVLMILAVVWVPISISNILTLILGEFLLIVVGSIVLMAMFIRPSATDSAALEQWKRQWYCLRCGNLFSAELPNGVGSSQNEQRGQLTSEGRPAGTRRSLYIDRVLDPVQRAKSMTDRDAAGLRVIRENARTDGSFDPVALHCDLGLVSRLSSLGLIMYDPENDEFRIVQSDPPRSHSGWWQQTFG